MKAHQYLPALLCALLLTACTAPTQDAGGAANSPDPVQAAEQTQAAEPSQEPTEIPNAEKAEKPVYLAPAEDGEHPQLIAHGGGAVHGYRLTNSLEALDASYAGGFRYIELDINLTEDEQVVLIHDWESMAQRMLFSPGIRTQEEFLASDTLADLTLLDLTLLLEWMDAHPDCAVVTDVKAQDNLRVLEMIRDAAGDAQARFIPQVYSFSEYTAAVELGYERVILTLYRLSTDAQALGEFVREQEPWAVTIPADSFSQELLCAVTDCGVAAYAHTVNSLDFFETWQPYGLTGIYTDYFIPAQWVY